MCKLTNVTATQRRRGGYTENRGRIKTVRVNEVSVVWSGQTGSVFKAVKAKRRRSSLRRRLEGGTEATGSEER